MALFESRIAGFAWIGASDDPAEGASEEGDWRWVVGPETGKQIPTRQRPAEGYSNWGEKEPDNFGGYENVATIDLGPPSLGGSATGRGVTPRRLPDSTDTSSSTARVCRPALGTPEPVMVGSAATVQATFSDADANDTHTALIAWGDGATTTGIVTEAGGAGTVSGTHAYSQAGVYTVIITVDDGDASGSRSSALDVPAYVVLQ